MEVLEQEHHGPLGPERLHQREESGAHVLDEGGLVATFLDESQEQAEPIRDPGGIVHPFDRSRFEELAEPAEGLLARVVTVDRHGVAHHRGRGSVGRAVGGPVSAAGQDARFRAEARDELVRQTRLADPRLAHHRDEQRPTRGDHTGEAVPQDGELVATPDERDRATHRPAREPVDRVRHEGFVEPLRGHVAPIAECGGVAGERVGGLTDQHLAGLGRRLQPRGRVHHRAGHQQLARRSDARGRLARLDPDAHLQLFGQVQLGAQMGHATADGEARSHGPQGVVLVHRRKAEDRHHGVPDELLRLPPKRAQFLRDRVVEPREHLARTLGVEPLG